ncbi:MAG: PadR family transcriptional regulator [Venatoribacter sp.]
MKDITRGRKFNAEELQLATLWFLRESPEHGYSLAKRFVEISGGYYQPSSGVLYPALADLEALGFAKNEPLGKRKTYHILPAGLAHLEQHEQQAQLLINTLKHLAKKMLWMQMQPEGEIAAAEATGWLPEFIDARKAFKAALLEKTDIDHNEQRRIADILRRATQEICA